MVDKNKKLLESFAEYCKAHPEQRFWQALRNWSEFAFILKANNLEDFNGIKGVTDTYYFENKKG